MKIILNTEKKKIVSAAERFMQENVPQSRLNLQGKPENYFRHVLGVIKYALLLAEKYTADKFVVEIAALLHDVGADVRENHAHESAKIADQFLSSLKLDSNAKQKIISCIEIHSMGSVAETLEEQIIQDADGLIFIEDTFKDFFEHKKQKLSLEEARKVSIEKNQKMMDKIKTEEGWRLAQKFLDAAIVYLNDAR